MRNLSAEILGNEEFMSGNHIEMDEICVYDCFCDQILEDYFFKVRKENNFIDVKKWDKLKLDRLREQKGKMRKVIGKMRKETCISFTEVKNEI